MGARWYDSSLGRWLSADTLVPEPESPQTLNRYSYVNNNPCKYKDPSGHCIVGYSGAVQMDQYPYGTSGVCPNTHSWIEEGNAAIEEFYNNPTYSGSADLEGALIVAGVVFVGAVAFDILITGATVACLDDGNCTNEAEAVIKGVERVGKALETVKPSLQSRGFSSTIDQLQHVFSRHGQAFGFSENWSKATGQKFFETLLTHVNGPNTQIIQGTYRGTISAIHYFDPATGRLVITDLYGNLISAWQLSAEQIKWLLTTGNVQ